MDFDSEGGYPAVDVANLELLDEGLGVLRGELVAVSAGYGVAVGAVVDSRSANDAAAACSSLAFVHL